MTDSLLTLRPARPGDEPLLLQLIGELAEYERMADQVQATETDLHDSLFGPRAVAHAVIAQWDEEAAGFALYFFNYSTFTGRPGLYLEDLYVRESHRGRGIGKALLLHLADIARQRDCRRMEWSVLDWNATAIAFYESLGARPQDDWTVYRLDARALEALAAGRG